MKITKSLLIVDEDIIKRNALRGVFAEEYTILEADGCATAMEVLIKKYDEIFMIFIDLQLLKKNNFDFIHEKNKNKTLSILPVIATCQKDDENAKYKAVKLGITNFISTPYKVQAIKTRVKSLLSNTAQEKIRLIRDLTLTSKRLGTLINSIPGGIIIFKVSKDHVLSVDYFNDKIPQLLGYERREFRELVNKDLFSIVYSDDVKRIRLTIRDYLHIERFEETFRLLHRDGSVRWVTLRAEKEDKELLSETVFVAVLINVTKEKKFCQELLFQDKHDQLTGIYNKKTFFKKTGELLQKQTDQSFSFVRFDIDNFKIVNDIFGLNTGDAVLKKIANLLSSTLRGIGTYGRLESDDFAACYPSHLLNTEKLLNGIRSCFADLYIDCDITISLGVYEIDDMTLPVDKMSDRAQLALKTIKGSFSKESAFYDKKLHDSIVFKQKLALEIQGALEKREFEIYLQPIYSISKQKTVSAEALIRWNHPIKGLLSSSVFIPICEKNGFITKLDAFMREEACDYLSKRQKEGKELFPISVNVSRLNIYNNSFCEDLVATVKRYGLEAKLLRIEITESAYTDDPERLSLFIERLSSNGFTVMMDDFGSEYSSLKMLKDISVDTLKIDRMFIKDIETSSRGSSILSSVVRIARWLDISVIAEGVENANQFDFLRSIGCDLIQGYFYSKPLSTKAFDGFLKKNSCNYLLTETTPYNKICVLDFIWKTDEQANFMFNSMITVSGIYELFNDNLEILRVNDSYYDLFGMTPDLFFKAGKNALSFVHENDKAPLLNACRKAQKSCNVESVEIRRKNHTTNEFLLLNVNIRHLGNLDSRSVFYFTLNDITEKKKNAIATSLQEYLDILKKTYSEIFKLDATAKTSTLLYLADETISTKMVLPLNEAFESYLKRVHEKDKDIVREFLYKTLSEPSLVRQKSSSLNYRIKSNDKYRWVTNTIFNFGDKIDELTFISCIKDINEERALEKAQKELTLRSRELQDTHEKMKIVMDYNDLEMWEYNIASGDFTLITKPSSSEREIRVINKETLFNMKESFSQESINTLKNMIKRLENGESNFTVSFSVKQKDGKMRWTKTTYTLFRDSEGNPSTATGIAIDITKEEQLRKLYATELQYKNYLTKNALAFFECDLHTNEILTKEYLTSLNVPPETTLSDLVTDYFLPRFYPTDRKLLPVRKAGDAPYETLSAENEDLYFEVRMRSKEALYNGYQWRSVRITRTINPITKHQHAFVYVSDIHKKKTEEILIRKKASRDPLTGLLDRVVFEEQTTAILSANKKSYVPGVFLIMDIDDFRNINNTMGHQRGDEVIRFAAKTLRAVFRSSDIIGRIGGDEMAVFMTGVSDKELALRKGMNLCNVFRNWENKDDDSKKITCSVGIAMAPTNNIKFEELYDKADKALYLAKQKGKNICCLYSEEDETE